MDNAEWQIEEMATIIGCNSCNGKNWLAKSVCGKFKESKVIAENLYKENYRKCKNVTLNIDLGKTSIGVQQIAAIFEEGKSTTFFVPVQDNEEKIIKKVAKDILQEWYDDNKSMGTENLYVFDLAEKYGVEIDEQ